MLREKTTHLSQPMGRIALGLEFRTEVTRRIAGLCCWLADECRSSRLEGQQRSFFATGRGAEYERAALRSKPRENPWVQ
jgi:hypothetical protein